LIALGLVMCCGAAIAAYMHYMKKKAPQRKKRAVGKIPAAQNTSKPVETRPLLQPPAPSPPRTTSVSWVQAPVPTTSVRVPVAAPISYSVPQPLPVTTAVAAPVQPITTAFAEPVVSYAAPVNTGYTPQTAMELFDELDINKDGRVSREEFQMEAARRGIPM
jgi:hypothetical protein